jgi:hypothetical protein
MCSIGQYGALIQLSPHVTRIAAVGKRAKLRKGRYLRTADIGAQRSMGASVCYA